MAGFPDSEGKEMKTCFYCKGPLRKRRIEHMHEWGGERYLIRNVSAEVCVQCGEVYLAPQTLKQIDALVGHKKPDGHASVAVYDLKPRAA
jgi:YgiT-type zinc finger domain-containing protein